MRQNKNNRERAMVMNDQILMQRIREIEKSVLDDEAYMEMARRRNAISSQMVRLEKCGCAACRDMIKLIDGRK